MVRKTVLASATCVIMMLALFCVLCLSRFHHIHGELEITGQMALIRSLFQDWYTYGDSLESGIPHLYALLQWGVGDLFGQVNSFTLRIVNLLCWLGTLGMAAGICRKRGGLFFLFFCVTCPLFVSAVTVVDFGCGLFPLLLLTLLASLDFWDHGGGSWNRSWWLVPCLSLCGWCDLRSSLLLLPVLLFWGWFRHGEKGLAVLSVAVLLGMAFFSVSWWLYGNLSGINWKQVFEGLPWVRLVLGFLLGIIAVFWGRYESHANRSLNPYLLAGGWLLVTQCIGAALPWNWIASVLVLSLGLWLMGCERWHWHRRCRQHRKGCLVLGGLALAFWALAVGDPLRLWRVELGEALALGMLSSIGLGLSLCCRILGFLGLMEGVICLTRIRYGVPRAAGVLSVLLGAQIGMLALQGWGDYQCSTVYGDRNDIRMAAAWIREAGFSAEQSLVPGEVLESLGHPDLIGKATLNLENITQAKTKLKKKQPKVLMLSWLCQSARLIRDFLTDDEVKEILKTYDLKQVGQVLIWKKRPEQSPANME